MGNLAHAKASLTYILFIWNFLLGFSWCLLLGRDNSSHNHPMSPPVWTHPQGTHGLWPTNPRVMSVELHITHDEFYSFPKPYGIRRITHRIINKSTTQFFNDVGSSLHVKYFQHLYEFEMQWKNFFYYFSFRIIDKALKICGSH